ncbi:hypothetical protein Fmac_027019 [Flemingia macrophylla]|uniref:Uncharacterized protein n=1 Tax=Flemingia macrophylla TaxID=520843 RepID=A0ABD1LI69_9FABA
MDTITDPSPSGPRRITALSCEDTNPKPKYIGFPQPKSASYTGMLIQLVILMLGLPAK